MNRAGAVDSPTAQSGMARCLGAVPSNLGAVGTPPLSREFVCGAVGAHCGALRGSHEWRDAPVENGAACHAGPAQPVCNPFPIPTEPKETP